jgi:flavin reductase (DIM6/NTAB) family NADH-FMN oxidoreductase RutF
MSATGHALRGIMRSVPMSVVVVTVRTDDGMLGMTAGSFTSVCLEPPLVCFNAMKSGRVHTALMKTALFAVSLLAEDQAAVAERFAQPGLDGTSQFESIDHRMNSHGLPLLGGALGWLTCRRRDVFEGGDHSIVLGEVRAIEPGRDTRPLIYHEGEYRRVGERVPGR